MLDILRLFSYIFGTLLQGIEFKVVCDDDTASYTGAIENRAGPASENLRRLVQARPSAFGWVRDRKNPDEARAESH